ncbi:gephyrin-like molybdotransferase Glp [Luteipulveratus mongoliensis]|uniref:molybdopterin molybdotransferase MoeA n=1 Tax=Luteipulveratus mongoliensis TaxID=571913 RepID=UPI002480A926|nr:gephyrin-like molybdotransferase Glp [Luteipulveratus mongoliensis]
MSLEQHRDRILSAVRPLAPTSIAVGESLGLVLAESVVGLVDLPGFTNSAMDGYAVVAADLVDAAEDSPVQLPVLGDIPAGDIEPHDLAAGSCWRIMTGAPLPAGADAVVPVEQTDGRTDEVAIRVSPHPGAAVRNVGEDVAAGDRVLESGVRLLPHHVAVCAAAGVASVDVIPAPRVAVITTGDELVPVGTPLLHGQIHDSNGPMLAAAVRAAGATCVEVLHVGDRDDESLADVVHRIAAEVDAIVTSGGISAGAYEPVKEAFAGGGAVQFDKVAMQPGKPQGFGVVGERGVPLFALPGNPVSSLVSFEVFVVPALLRMAGRSGDRISVRAKAVRGWRSPPGRVQVARVVLSHGDEGWVVSPSGGQGSHILGGLAVANALALVPAEVVEVGQGDVVEVHLLPGEELPS